jgi:hypothetical protein
MSIIIGSTNCPVLIDTEEHLVLLKSVSDLLGVQMRSLTKRLDRAGLMILTHYASKSVMGVFLKAGAISAKERYTRVLTIDALRRLMTFIGASDPEGASRIDTLICDVNELGHETATSNFLKHAGEAPESPKDKATRVAAMPSLKESVQHSARGVMLILIPGLASICGRTSQADAEILHRGNPSFKKRCIVHAEYRDLCAWQANRSYCHRHGIFCTQE